MKWLGQSISTSSAAGLNKAFQDMITLQNQMRTTEENTKAIKENTAAIRSKGSWSSRDKYIKPFVDGVAVNEAGGFNL